MIIYVFKIQLNYELLNWIHRVRFQQCPLMALIVFDAFETYGHTAKTIQDNALSRQIRQGGRCSDAMAAMVLAEPPSAKLFHTDVSCQRCGPCDWSKPVRSFSTVLALPQGAFARGATIAEDAWCLPVVRLPPWRIASQTWNWAKQFRLQCGPDAFKAPPRLCVEPIFWTLELAST
jgi:hypothetical protein